MNERLEHLKCSKSVAYFVATYCMIEEPKLDTTSWIPFDLWPFQKEVLRDIHENAKVTVLKARQLGLTWLVVAYALWLMLFKPGSVILIFSAGDTEAKNLLSRLKGMHEHLPPFLQASTGLTNDHNYEFKELKSKAISFASTKKAGRSFTGTMAIIDEADWITWFKQVMAAVKPTIDNGGKMVMLSTPDKERPASPFKTIWKAAYAGLSSYKAIFLAWFVHPGRNKEWYAQQLADAEHEDDVHQEYPATPEEALSGRASKKRFSTFHLERVKDFIAPIADAGPAIPGFAVYEEPEQWDSYVVAIDTCEGDPDSDPSPVTVFSRSTWREVAHLYGRFEPVMLAHYSQKIAAYYNDAVLCPERNNHGHAVIAAYRLTDVQNVYVNPFDGKLGWLTSPRTKPMMMDFAAETFKKAGCKLRTEASVIELAGIDSSTLAALEGETDDRAMSVVIGLAALHWPGSAEPTGGLQVQGR